jgi:hypothetical protein
VQKPGPGCINGQDLFQHVAKIVDLNVALAEGIDESVVLLASLLDPEDVVEQQGAAVVRGQTLEAEVGTMNQDLAEPADFGVGAERWIGEGCGHSGLMLPFQMR